MLDIQKRLGFSPARWDNGRLVILDQRRLPIYEDYLTLNTPSETADAIASLAVRGAPLIGIVAAYGLCLVDDPRDDTQFANAARAVGGHSPDSGQPRLGGRAHGAGKIENIKCDNLQAILIAEAARIHAEDARACARIGEIGNGILPDRARILTHCNAGALATGGIGTALGVIYAAHFSGKRIEVWVDETRPVLQGARLTAWELAKAGVPFTLIADNMAGHIMSEGKVDLVITGADRIAANLDFANKIGTYGLAVLAHHHGIPFYAAAPSSTFDPACPDGRSIVIENRPQEEIRSISGNPIAPLNSPVYNPAFDITPHQLITGIITETEIKRP